MSDEAIVDYMFKVIAIGDSSVGKTSIIHRYCKNTFAEKTKPTIGVEFYTKSLDYNDENVKLQIWDTAGQERFRGMASNYYKGACGVLLVYDVTCHESFKNLEIWYDEIIQHVRVNTAIVIVGNKKDIKDKREITEEDAKHYAKCKGSTYIETSAANNEGHEVQSCFRKLVDEIFDKGPRNQLSPQKKRKDQGLQKDEIYLGTEKVGGVDLDCKLKKDDTKAKPIDIVKKDKCAC